MKCFMGDGLSTFMDYVNASGVDISDMTAVQTLGQKVGMELVIKCPALITIMMNMAKDTTEVKKNDEIANYLIFFCYGLTFDFSIIATTVENNKYN
ncbi:MAG: hypothetical protein WDM71_03100 [Ferruginibacter sp.]